MLSSTFAKVLDRVLSMEPFTFVLLVTGVIGELYGIWKRQKEPIGHSVQKLDLSVGNDKP